MKIIKNSIIQFLLFLPLSLYSQNLSQIRADEFISKLIKNSNGLEKFVLSQELKISKRLNIKYEGVKNKFLISYDIDLVIKDQLDKDNLIYDLQIERLDDSFSRLYFEIPSKNYIKEFYFKGDYLISPLYFHTANWKRIESDHFIFLISDPGLFNRYSIDNLENFLNRITSVLKLDEGQVNNLLNNKIYYILCRDEDEIKKLTGFRTRGIYNLAYDYVITTFNSHYHELMHLLINYSLSELPLYTHPFFQEGFAVAFGGRGGKEPKVILDLGLFLQQSNMLDYSALLSKSGFYQVDISLSYPLGGLYNYFLIEELGIESYLKLYLKYSGSAERINNIIINPSDLLPVNNWKNFLSEYSKKKIIEIKNEFNFPKLIFESPFARISENATHYFFQIKDTLLVSTDDKICEFQSKKFAEVFKNRQYSGEKYLIIVNYNEVAIYNLYTNNLMANFISSFSIPMKLVPQKDGFFEFSVLKKLFDESLSKVLKKN
jgi:hypothetical protein